MLPAALPQANAWQIDCDISHFISLGPPAHVVNRPAAECVEAVAGDHESDFLVEGDGAAIVGIHIEIEPARGEAFGLGNELAADAGAPKFRCDHKLVEIERAGVDGDETDDPV